MAKKHYLPKIENERAIWLANFYKQISGPPPSGPAATMGEYLGLSPAEITQTGADNKMYRFCIGNQDSFKNEKQERTTYKNLVANGKEGKTMKPYPTVPVIAPPPPVPQGIFKRISRLVARIKSSANYTPALGKKLGIIGAEQKVDTAKLKPVINVKRVAQGVLIKWKKKVADGLQIHVDRGDGFTQLATDLQPPYTDTFELPLTAATWKYRAIYIIKDKKVGQWSDEVHLQVAKR